MSETMCTSKAACGCQNLNNAEVRKREVLAYGSLIVALALVGLSKLHRQPGWLSAASFLPFFFAYVNVLQARTRTCVFLAFAERDKSDSQITAVPDRETAWRLKQRSVQIIAAAAALALLSVAVCWKL